MKLKTEKRFENIEKEKEEKFIKIRRNLQRGNVLSKEVQLMRLQIKHKRIL